jgi:SAM-dependent methyltransferase
MAPSTEHEDKDYNKVYEEFDSPLKRQLRSEAYSEDIGQHSWVTANDLEKDISRLKLSRASRLLDLGCGPGGPLTFVAGHVGCKSSGIDVSGKAIAAARARAASLGLERLTEFCEGNLNLPLPFVSGSFDAVMSLDVIIHLQDRLSAFREVARVLVPAGKFLFTDAGVITGAICGDEVRLRSVHGHTQFVPPGFNEKLLRLAGFRVIDCEDRTASLLKIAGGRLTARLNHRQELEALEGTSYFEQEQRYLETVVELSKRGAVSRLMYLTESSGK